MMKILLKMRFYGIKFGSMHFLKKVYLRLSKYAWKLGFLLFNYSIIPLTPKTLKLYSLLIP